MKLFKFAAAILVTFASSAAWSTPILCEDDSVNHMSIDDSEISACLDAGTGNLSGNPSGGNADPFLTGVGSDYTLVSKSDEGNPFNVNFSQGPQSSGSSTGSWSFDASFWDTFAEAAIGFKFGTGNRPDEWFVYSVADLVSSGSWEFINMFERGGGLSHVNLYARGESRQVPEPSTLGLLGLGLLGIGMGRRRNRRLS